MTFLATNHKINLFGFQISVTARRAVRKPHHHDMRNAHREHLLAVDRQKLKLAERGLWPRIQAAIWRQLND